MPPVGASAAVRVVEVAPIANPNAGGGVATPLLEAAARGDSVSVRLLLEAGAAILAADAGDLEKAIGRLLADGQECSRLGEKAGCVFSGLSGSIDRHIQWIDRALPLSMPGAN